MKFNFKRNSKKNPTIEDIKSNLWQRFDEANLRLQHKCANWLERKTSHFSRLNWIIILFCFTIGTGACSIYLIVNSITGDAIKNVSVTPINKPTNAVAFEHETMKVNPVISTTEFENIILLRRHIDSLGRSPTGKKTYDSIVRFRPGLLDSLQLVEQYYQSQLKK
ncbi:hypothetical protein [Flavobacterium sp. PL02]|uniref:hypothetical protein n=1 Tax=Flavobacterium sp. PL02 TaxID=3088354 RepID=UPI002B2251B1|nr:hypothetical protein [Flavobacterium sp. PL02]MEA9414272.1 hypothetical protein [Flavobacterium sp. PL02]